jgi:hypothetical protein
MEQHMTLPSDNGYSVADGTVHKRYPAHPTREYPRRVRTVVAVRALLPDATPCDECYPQEKKRASGPVSRSTKRTVPKDRPAPAASVPDPREGMAAPSGNHDTTGLRHQTPAPTGEDANQDHPLPLLRHPALSGQPDDSGSPDTSGEGREDGAE